MDNTTFGLGDKLMQVEAPIESGTKYSGVMKLSEATQTRDGKSLDTFEFRIGIPDLTATELPATADIKFSLQFSDSEAFASTSEIVEISDSRGAANGSSSGAEGKYVFFKAPYKRGQYVRVKTVGTNVGTTTKKYTFDYMV